MAYFKCGACDYEHPVEDYMVGMSVSCPKCKSRGTVTGEAVAPNVAQTAATPARRRTPMHLFGRRFREYWPAAVWASMFLLAWSVVLQLMILRQMRKTHSVEVENRVDVDVDRTVDVNVENIFPMPVKVESIAPLEELDVKLKDHFILDGDPIPVRVVR